MKYIAFDTETGGLQTDKSLLTLYAVILDENFRTLEEIDLKLKPNQGTFVVTKEAMQVNKINLLTHQVQAISYSIASEKFTDLLVKHTNNGKDRLIPIGSNIPFDKAFIREYLVWDLDKYVSYKNLDIGSIFEFMKLAGHAPLNASGKLGDLAERFNVKVNADLHTAKEDTLVAVRILKRMIDICHK